MFQRVFGKAPSLQRFGILFRECSLPPREIVAFVPEILPNLFYYYFRIERVRVRVPSPDRFGLSVTCGRCRTVIMNDSAPNPSVPASRPLLSRAAHFRALLFEHVELRHGRLLPWLHQANSILNFS